MSTVPKPTVVCVLGMHRSGTSLVTRLLNLLGVELGPVDHLVKPAADNPKGFWEHEYLFRINKRILIQLGGHSHEPPVFSANWESGPEMEPLRERAREIISEDFAGAEIWGWKDPRTSLTLRFWQQIVPAMHYVICIRNPVAVAQSLQRRDNLSPLRGMYLWLAYMQAALRDTAGQSRIIVIYDDLLDDCQRELERLSAFIGRREQAVNPETREAARDFVDTGLRHHTRRPIDAMHPAQLPEVPPKLLALTEQIYACLEREKELFPQEEIDGLLRAALALVPPHNAHD